MNYTPEHIDKLEPNEIFVFGSNMHGNHAGGAARLAVEKFGAVTGQAEGLQGQSYAIPTLSKKMAKLSLKAIGASVDRLLKFAGENTDNTAINGKPLHVRSAQIDGKILKEDTYYKLVNGEFVEV